jgi:acyl-CoA synthetase (AMP-forming)/AMP-acid ligase II
MTVRYDQELVSIPRMVRISAQRFGDRAAVVDDDERWSFVDVERRMLRVVRAMIAAGVEPGDRVALCGPNSARWIEAALGVLGAGAVLVPLNTRFKGEEIAHVLRTSGASALLTVSGFLGSDFLAMVRQAAPDAAALQRVVVLDDVEVDGSSTFAAFLDAGDALPEEQAVRRVMAVEGDQLSDIMFTSGTTGAPKGVMLKHSQSLRAYGWLSEVFTFRPGDCFLVIPPFFHTFGYKAGWMSCLLQGVTCVPQRTFDVEQVLERIERHRVSILLGPPTLFVDLMAHPRLHDVDLSSLRVTVPSAASVPVQLITDLREVLGFDIVLNAYGLTESTSLVSSCRPDDEPERVATTVGRPVDDVEVVIAGDDGEHLPDGSEGEIWVRGYTVMEGYWDDPEATARAITPDGFLRTGDIGVIDDDGFLRITDRKKDMFIVGGFNAYPAEIEGVLGRFDPVLHVAVVGAPDERLGEVGVAFVVPRPGSSVTPEDVVAYAREHLANYKVPRRVVVVDDLPRNASMKVVKHELRARLAIPTEEP